LDQSSFNTASVCQIPAIESQNLAGEDQMPIKEHAIGFSFIPIPMAAGVPAILIDPFPGW
jgi:hypothetical protein